MALGYTLPGTTIDEVTTPSSANITTTQRLICFIGTASASKTSKNEAVVRTSTGATPLADDLTYTDEGISAVSVCGSQKGLNDYVAGTHYDLTGNQIVWTSSGVVTNGATYYVTYTYDRPSSDYGYKLFYDYEDVLNDLGTDIPTNPLVNIAKLALRYYNLPAIAVVQVPVTETSSDYSAALALAKYRDIQTICVLNSSTTIRALVIAHVNERSLAVNGKFRVSYTGAPASTILGTEDNAASLRGMVTAIANERIAFVNATRAKYYYNDPTTNLETFAVKDGAFIAAAVAAYRDSFIHPTTTLLNKIVPGIELYDEDYDDYYDEGKLTLAGSSSLYLLAPSGGMTAVIDDLTSDNSTVERNNANIITAKDYVAKDVIIQINRTFKGSLIKNRSTYKQTVLNYLQILFKAYLQNNVIESISTLKVTMPTTSRDTVNIFYSYYAVYTHKYTEGTYALEV